MRHWYGDVLRNQFNVPLQGTVDVRAANASPGTGALITIYSDDSGTTKPNPVSTDVYGQWDFYAPDQRVDFVFKSPQSSQTIIWPNVEISDVTEAGGATGGSVPGSSDSPWAASRLNNIRFADQFGGATADLKLIACIADVISAGGGECDARGLIGTQTIASQVDVGNTSFVPVLLRLPHQATWNVTITDGVSCGFMLHSKSSIVGTGAAGNEGMILTAGGSTSADSIICTEASPSGGGQYVRAEGFQIYNPSGGTFASAAINWRKVFDGSVIRDAVIADYKNDGLLVYQACCGSSFQNIVTNGNGTGGRGVFVKADSGGRNNAIAFSNISAGHAGSGFANFEISGSGGATPNDTPNQNIIINNLYSEFSAGNVSTALKISDAREVLINGLETGVVNATAGSVGVSISQTASNQVRDIRINGYRYAQAGGSTGLVNSITGESLMTSTAYLPLYSFGGSSGTQTSQPIVFADSELDLKSVAGNTIYQFGTNGNPVFRNWADTAQNFSLSSGAAAAQNANIFFQDRGTTEWIVQKSSANQFLVFDFTNSVNRLVFPQTANTAASGLLRAADTETAVAWRNHANGGDIALAKTGAASGSLPADSLDISAFGGVKGNGIYQFPEVTAPAGSANNDILYADSTAHRLKMNNNNNGALTVAATSGDTFTSTTLTSPIINGSPTGTGIPTLTLKKGSGGGNYTSASTTYVVVDSTNLCNTVTIPTGWKLLVTASGDLGTSTAVVAASYAITDNAACSTANAGILVEGQVFGNVAGNTEPFSKSYVINGDGASHNVALQFKTANGADSALLLNSSATLLPTMTFLLTPSN